MPREYGFVQLPDIISFSNLNACNSEYGEKFVRKAELAPEINFSKLWLSLRPFDEVALTEELIFRT
jgi:hypothetical protein